MLKTFAIISFVTSAAFAQSSSGTPAPSASSAANPFIPSGISKGCTDFLTALDNDKDLSACTSALSTATAGFMPGGSAGASPTSAQVKSALSSLCSTSTAAVCPESLVRGKIADFYSACSAELMDDSHKDIIRTYDVLYSMLPFKDALCSKDDGGNSCATQTKLPAGSKPNLTSGSGEQAPLVPDIDEYKKFGVPFLFLTPSLPKEQLCVSCTRNVLTSFITFESNVPYGPGISKSPLLSGQSALYSTVQDTCGKNFLSGVVQAAGGLSGGTFSSGAVHNLAGPQGLIAAGMGLFAAVASVL